MIAWYRVLGGEVESIPTDVWKLQTENYMYQTKFASVTLQGASANPWMTVFLENMNTIYLILFNMLV